MVGKRSRKAAGVAASSTIADASSRPDSTGQSRQRKWSQMATAPRTRTADSPQGTQGSAKKTKTVSIIRPVRALLHRPGRHRIGDPCGAGLLTRQAQESKPCRILPDAAAAKIGDVAATERMTVA